MPVANWNSRILTNAIIGFTKWDPTWPSPLANLGWYVSLLEGYVPVRAPDQQAPSTLRPDLILVNAADRTAIVSECKAGTVQQSQLANYQKLTLDNLREHGVERGIDSMQVVYFGTEPHRES